MAAEGGPRARCASSCRPRLLRGFFRKRRELLLDLAQCSAEALGEYLRRALGVSVRPGIVVSIATAGDLLQWHPHAIPFEDKRALEDVASYMVRAPLSLKKLVYLDGQQAVPYRSKMNPSLGRHFEAIDPLEWVARLADHIPDTGKHRTHFYGFYASRVRASRTERAGSRPPAEPAPGRRRCPPSWARLLSSVYHSDPLTCRRCGGKLKITAYVSDEISIKRILAELGLSPPQDE